MKKGFEIQMPMIAELPFDQIDLRRVSCTFKGNGYAVSAKQGTFMRKAGSSLSVMPEAGRIVLDFSAR